MKRTFLSLAAAVGILAAVLPSPAARADDETDDVEIKLRAPLDAVDCTTVPPTITVLGLSIDVSTAFMGGDHEDGEHGDLVARDGGEDGDDGEDGDGEDGGGAGGGGGCEALAVGQTVGVRLASDAAPLMATEVDQEGDGVELKAPLQAVDAIAQTVTVLGLLIDASAASIKGADDDDSEEGSAPIDLGALMPGQFVEVKLDPALLPVLVATEIEVKNFGNQVEVEVDDPDGDEIEDVDDDVQVEVAETVKVQNPAPGARGKVSKVVYLRTRANGSFTLAGLPTGSAKITVTRSADGVTMTRTRKVRVRGNASRSVHLRLRTVD